MSGRPQYTSYDRRFSQVVGRTFGRIIRTTLVLILAVVLLIAGFGVGMIYGYVRSTEPIPANLMTSGVETSLVYDSEGNLLSRQTGTMNIDRQNIAYADIADTYVAKAFIAIEDERFYDHIGIDPKRIASALVSAVINSGSPTHGGSTIVQQTIKLITGNDRRSSQRKVQEWYRAIMLNEQLSKNTIMEYYLNLVPMGNNFVGIETAAQGYFGKHAKDLTLPECALLAGIPRAPSFFNPKTEVGRRNALRRQRIVLGKMAQLGMITKKEYDDAMNTDLEFVFDSMLTAGTHINSYFVEYALKEVVRDLEAAGVSRVMARQMVSSGGLKIYTTMEPTVQRSIDTVFGDVRNFARRPERYFDAPEQPEGGMVIINNETGAIAGIGGGVGPKRANLVLSRGTDIARQPGSSIKPLAVYGPALELGLMTGASMLLDDESRLDPDNPDKIWPTNSYTNPPYLGLLNVRFALKVSANVPAVKTMATVGVETGKYYLYRLGIDRRKDQVQLALAMGSPQRGMSPLEMAAGYATFPSNGLFRKPYSYTKVEDRKGRVILEKDPQPTQVFKPSTAYMMTSILEEAVRGVHAFWAYGSCVAYGPVKNAAGQTIPTAAKTGTTQDKMDKWLCAYTPYYTGAVWLGFDNRIKRTPVHEENEDQTKHVWFQVMNRVHADLEPKEFVRPPNIVEVKICAESGQLPGPDCPEWGIYPEHFPEDSPLLPHEICHVHNELAPTPTLPTEVTDPTSSAQPTGTPTAHPTGTPSATPTKRPTAQPTPTPTPKPTKTPGKPTP